MQAPNVIPGVPMTMAVATVRQFADPTPYMDRPYVIAGTTKNSASAALGGCVVNLFATATNVLQQTSTSDGSGNYVFGVNDPITTWYVVAYLAGSPDVAGTTVNTLVGT
jgi:hypothetical protein